MIRSGCIQYQFTWPAGGMGALRRRMGARMRNARDL